SSNIRADGEFYGNNSGGVKFRLITTTVSTLLYSDPSNFYILLTNSGDQYGSFNGLRPFRVGLTDGTVTMAHHVTVGNGVYLTGGDFEGSNNQVRTGAVGNSYGQAVMNGGGTGQAGFFASYHPNGTRMFYMGYMTDRAFLQVEVGGRFDV